MKYFYPCMPNRLDHTSQFFNEIDRDAGWIAEVKKNGWRALPVKSEGEITIWTRHKTLITEPVLNIRSALKRIVPEGTILDGEFINNRTRNIKGRLYLFDIIMLEGKLLTNLPLKERRRILESLITETGDIELARQVRVGKRKLFFQSIEGDLNEGIVLKKLDSKYPVSDSRCLKNPFWMKVKKIGNHVKVGG